MRMPLLASRDGLQGVQLEVEWGSPGQLPDVWLGSVQGDKERRHGRAGPWTILAAGVVAQSFLRDTLWASSLCKKPSAGWTGSPGAIPQ